MEKREWRLETIHWSEQSYNRHEDKRALWDGWDYESNASLLVGFAEDLNVQAYIVTTQRKL